MRTMLQGPFSGALIHQLERLFHQGTAIGVTEGELLERFVRGQDETAFEALIARHGPMVLGVCRQLLRDPNDVDDAFQATFLVLVRKAGTLRRCDLLGNWLYGVAYRVATRARILAARRWARAPHGQEVVDQLDARDRLPGLDPEKSGGQELEPRPWLHEEVGRLPEKYRVAVRLCYFEGLTHDEVARRLGWPLGTVKGRLARARDLLRRRLTRRGVTLSAAALASHLAVLDLRAAVPASLEYATLKAAQALVFRAGASLASISAVSLPVAALTQGVARAMVMTQVKAIALPLLVIAAVTTGVVIGATQGIPQEAGTNPPIAAGSEPAEPSSTPKAQPPGAQEKSGPIEKRRRAAAKARSSPAVSSPAKGAESPDRPSAQPPATSEAHGQAGPAGASAGGMMGQMRGPMMGRGGMMGGRMGGMGGMGGGMGGFGPSGPSEFQSRLEIAQLAVAVAVSEKNPKNEALLKRLEEPVAMSFANPTPLDDVLKYIKNSMVRPGHPPCRSMWTPRGCRKRK